MSKRTWYYVLSVLALAGVLAMLKFFIVANTEDGMLAMLSYRAALWSILVAVCCIELRVQVTHRTPKSALFWMHLSTAVPFALALLCLGYVGLPLWLRALAAVLCMATLIFGAAFFWRGMRRFLIAN